MTGRDPSSEILDVGGGLWERIAEATQDLQHAEASVWNGRLDYVALHEEDSVRGAALHNGTLQFSGPLVLESLQKMYAEGQDALRDPESAARCWHALKVTGHEFGHLTGPRDWTVADRLADLARADLEPIEEAFTEAHCYATAPELIDRTVSPELASGLHRVQRDHPELVFRSYPGWTAAGEAFANDVSAETGVPATEVLRVAAREPDSRKAPALADLMFQHSRLPQLLPEQMHAAAKANIGAVIDKGFADLDGSKWDKTTAPGMRGAEIADAAIQVVRSYERDGQGSSPTMELRLNHYGPPDPEQRRSGVAPPRDDRTRNGQGALAGMSPAAGAPSVPRDEAAQVRRASHGPGGGREVTLPGA